MIYLGFLNLLHECYCVYDALIVRNIYRDYLRVYLWNVTKYSRNWYNFQFLLLIELITLIILLKLYFALSLIFMIILCFLLSVMNLVRSRELVPRSLKINDILFRWKTSDAKKYFAFISPNKKKLKFLFASAAVQVCASWAFFDPTLFNIWLGSRVFSFSFYFSFFSTLGTRDSGGVNFESACTPFETDISFA